MSPRLMPMPIRFPPYDRTRFLLFFVFPFRASFCMPRARSGVINSASGTLGRGNAESACLLCSGRTLCLTFK